MSKDLYSSMITRDTKGMTLILDTVMQINQLNQELRGVYLHVQLGGELVQDPLDLQTVVRLSVVLNPFTHS